MPDAPPHSKRAAAAHAGRDSKRPRDSKNKGYDTTDESEVFKHKSLMAAKNRRKFAKITQYVLYAIAAFIVAACVFAYFFDK